MQWVASSLKDELTELYGQVDICKSCRLGDSRIPLLPLHGDGCTSDPDLMLVAINPSYGNATIQPAWHGKKLAMIPVKNRKPKFWSLMMESGLFEVSPELKQAIFNQLSTPETVERLIVSLRMNKIFLADLVKCPTPGQKGLFKPMIDACSQMYLSTEIRLLSPKVICAWGKLPFDTLTGSSERFGAVIDWLDEIKELTIDDLPHTIERFGELPCYPCYFHIQTPGTDSDKIRHLKRLRTILGSA